MHRMVICSIGSTPATLPAATALALRSTNFSFWNTFWQYLQYQVPLGILGRGTHSAISQINQHHKCNSSGLEEEEPQSFQIVHAKQWLINKRDWPFTQTVTRNSRTRTLYTHTYIYTYIGAKFWCPQSHNFFFQRIRQQISYRNLYLQLKTQYAHLSLSLSLSI